MFNEKRQSIGKKVQSLGWLFWPNESKSSHVIIGNIVFIINAEIAGITSSTTKIKDFVLEIEVRVVDLYKMTKTKF